MKEYVKKLYMCPNCFELYTKEEAEKMNNIHFHPEISENCNEADDYLIPIDEPIAESIAKMNKKGWKTNFSCSGHYCENHTFSEFYVTFELDDYNFSYLPGLLMLEPVGMEYEIERNSTLDLSGLTCYRCRISPRNKDYTFTSLFTLNSKERIDGKPIFSEKDYEKFIGWRDRVYHKSFQEWVDRLPCIKDESIYDNIDLEDNKYASDILNELKSEVSDYLSDKIDIEYYRQGFIDICKSIRKNIISALEIINDANKHNANIPGNINTNNAKEVANIYKSLKEGGPISTVKFDTIMKILNLNYCIEIPKKDKNGKYIYIIRYLRD